MTLLYYASIEYIFYLQAIKYLQSMIIQAHRQKRAQLESGSDKENSKPISIDPKTWVKLGHFHLLLEEYEKGVLFVNYSYVFSSVLFHYLQRFRPTRDSTGSIKTIIGRMRLFFTAWGCAIFNLMLFSGKFLILKLSL